MKYNQELESILKKPDRTEALLDLTKLYRSADSKHRAYIANNWDFGVVWKATNPMRLACSMHEKMSCEERIFSSLIYMALENQVNLNNRENYIGIAIIYNSCILANLDPDEIFREVAAISGPSFSRILTDFVDRIESDKNLAAFMLAAERDGNGEYEIRFDIPPPPKAPVPKRGA
jgi:hypothetical protein